MSGVRLGACSFALGLCLTAVPHVAAIPTEPFRTNVRPFFAVGYSAPVHFDEFDRGFGLSFGFEAENSARASILFASNGTACGGIAFRSRRTTAPTSR